MHPRAARASETLAHPPCRTTRFERLNRDGEPIVRRHAPSHSRTCAAHWYPSTLASSSSAAWCSDRREGRQTQLQRQNAQGLTPLIDWIETRYARSGAAASIVVQTQLNWMDRDQARASRSRRHRASDAASAGNDLARPRMGPLIDESLSEERLPARRRSQVPPPDRADAGDWNGVRRSRGAGRRIRPRLVSAERVEQPRPARES